MILPTTYAVALLLTILWMLCWGSWANTFKLAGKWRFELFYFDYSLGVLITSVIAAFTFGSLGADLSFTDNLMISGKRQIAYGLAAGAVFNLANILLLAAISVAGMAFSFPVVLGLALVIGVIWTQILSPSGSPLFLFGGAGLVVAAVVASALAWRAYAAGKQIRSWKGIVLSVVSGVIMGSIHPLLDLARAGEIGLGPYAIAFMFSLGLFFSTFIFNLYFINLPVEGAPVGLVDYFRGTMRQHALGAGGGIVWCLGLLANFVASTAPPEARVGPALSRAIGESATLVNALWGLLVWKEFAGASARVRLLLGLMFWLFAGGLALVSIAPMYGD